MSCRGASTASRSWCPISPRDEPRPEPLPRGIMGGGFLFSIRRGVRVMQRRTFLAAALAASNAPPLPAALAQGRWDDAAGILERATAAKQVDAAVLHVARGDRSST